MDEPKSVLLDLETLKKLGEKAYLRDEIEKLVRMLVSKVDSNSPRVVVQKEINAAYNALKGNNDTYLAESLASLRQVLQKQMEDIQVKLSKEKKGDKGDKGDVGEPGETPIKGIDYFDGKKGEPGANGSPDTPQEIVEKIESLTGAARLDARAIKGLDEVEARLNSRITAAATPRSNNGVKFYDLSSQTNGSTKIFTVPKGLAGVIIGSDFPTILMENNGFTLNKTRTQLTLTFATAPSAGSQLLYQYSSMFN